MTVAGLEILKFRGHDINDGIVYAANFTTDDETGALDIAISSAAVETERPGNSPLHVRTQPNGSRIALEVEILELSQSNFDILKSWFSTFGEPDYLTATDGDSVERRLLCICEKFTLAEGTTVLKASLRSASGLWEENTTDEEAAISTATINNPGDTFTIDNPGTAKSYPYLAFKPTASKSSTVSYTKRNRVSLAHRSELKPFDDPNCPDGGPMELTEGALGGMDDSYRVLLYGREQNRWLGDSGSSMWANLTLPPRSSTLITLGSFIDGSSLELEAGNPSGFASLPEGPAFILIDEERILYTAKSTDKRKLTGLIRGTGNTTPAAHSEDTPIYAVPLPYLDILSGIDTPDTPPQDPDRKPVIDLDNSTNTSWTWSGQLYVPNSHRSGQWVPSFVDEGLSSHHLRINPSGLTSFLFEDLLPSAGRPRFNNLIKDFPCGLKADTGIFTLDFNVGVNLLLQAFVTDIDGNESRLVTEFWSDGNKTGQAFDSGDVLKRVRLNARIAAIAGDLDVGSANLSEQLAKVYFQEIAVNLTGGGGAISLPAYVFYAISIELTAATSIFGILLRLSEASGTQPPGTPSGAPGQTYLTMAAKDSPISLSTQDPIFDAISFKLLDDLTSTPTLKLLRPVVGLSDTLPETTLPAGKYWLSITGFTLAGAPAFPSGSLDLFNFTINAEKEDAGLHWAQALQPEWDSSIATPSGPVRWVLPEAGEPIFAILSRTAEPQSDAPLQTGNTIAIANPIAVFDDETPRTPKIVVGNEEDCYLFGSLTDGGRLTNETTGEYIKIRFPSALNAGFSVDFENRRIIDEETGLSIPHALIEVSNPNDWPSNQPGTNTWSWVDDDVGTITIDGISRGRYL